MDDRAFTIREAADEDLGAVARLAAEMIRFHHRLDQRRFSLLSDDPEAGYRWWLGRRLHEPDAVVLAAVAHGEDGGERVVGYAYGELEEKSWVALLEEHGEVHDLFVDPGWRRRGVGEALMREGVRRLAAKGARRVVLSAAWKNPGARRLFKRIGFRPTMVEMTIEPEEREG